MYGPEGVCSTTTVNLPCIFSIPCTTRIPCIPCMPILDLPQLHDADNG